MPHDAGSSNPEQLELFADGPFTIRLKMDDAMRIFWENYWKHLPFGQKSKAIRERIVSFFLDRTIDSVSKHDVEDFRRHLRSKELSESTINKCHMTLTRLYSKLKEYKEAGTVHGINFSTIVIPQKNPGSQVPKVNERGFSRKIVITPDEFKILRSYADDDLKDILNMLVWTRLRPSDVRRLTESNINRHARQLEGTQHKTITTRNPSGVPYVVPLTARIEEVLNRRIAIVKPGTPLFNWSAMQKRWGQARSLSGLLLIQMRDLRRSAATYLHDTGTELATVSQGLGHTTTRTTEIYVPRMRKHLAESTEKLVEAFG